jgi:uncharacterized protein (TIGR02001 family)
LLLFKRFRPNKPEAILGTSHLEVSMNFRTVVSAAILATTIPTTALAETAKDWTLEGGLSASSDYRFRGISLSDDAPAGSAELSLNHKSGFYASVWASNVALDGSPDELETDWIVGWSGSLGKADVEINGTYYVYPGNSAFNYYELNSAVGTSIGKTDVKIGVAYAPKQDSLGGLDNTYVYISGEAPIGETPIAINGSIGIEDGAFGEAKRDWQLGLTYDLGSGLVASLSYIDTARSYTPLGKATAVAALNWSF